MSSLHHALYSSWKCDRKILYIFALYGLAAGIMTHVLSISEDRTFNYIILQLNFPAVMVLLYIEWNLANPSGLSILFHPVMIVAGSMAAWSFFGLLAYLLVRMFKMGP